MRLMTAAAICALMAHPVSASILTDEQMDAVVGGYELGSFQTTILNIANSQYLDTFNVMNPYFAPGTPVIYFGPFTGLLQSGYTVTFSK